MLPSATGPSRQGVPPFAPASRIIEAGTSVGGRTQRPARSCATVGARRRDGSVLDWNVVVTTEPEGFDEAATLLTPLGLVRRTRYYNVLVMEVDDVGSFLEALDRRSEEEARLEEVISRVLPATRTFGFDSPEEFRERTSRAAADLAPRLAGRSFHVRMHRRGHQGELSTQDEEERIATAVFDALERDGRTAEVTFDDPDAVLDVETVGDRAGMSLWTREDLARHPLLQVD